MFLKEGTGTYSENISLQSERNGLYIDSAVLFPRGELYHVGCIQEVYLNGN